MAEAVRKDYYDDSDLETTEDFDGLQPANDNSVISGMPVSNVQKEYRSNPSGAANSNHPINSSRVAGRVGRKAAGTAAQGAGMAVQGVGRGVSAASKAAAAIPVIGTGVAAVGTVAGRGIEAAGTGVRRVRNVTKKTGPTRTTSITRTAQVLRGNQYKDAINRIRPDVANTNEDLAKKKIKNTAGTLFWVNLIIISPIVAICYGIFFYVLDLKECVGDSIASAGKCVGASLLKRDVAEAGMEIAAYTGALDDWMWSFWGVGFIVSAGFMFACLDILRGAGAEPNGSIKKKMMFLFALIGSFIPFLNAVPWSAWWLHSNKKKPVVK